MKNQFWEGFALAILAIGCIVASPYLPDAQSKETLFTFGSVLLGWAARHVNGSNFTQPELPAKEN